MPRLVVRGYGSPSTPTPPVTSGTTFWDALRAYLKSCPSLSAITEVYYRRTKPGYTFPYLVVEPINDTPEINNSGTYWIQAQIQFSIVTNDDVQAEILGEAAYKWLAPKQNPSPGEFVPRTLLTWDLGKEMGAIPGRVMRSDQPGRTKGNQNAWAHQFQYTFLASKTMGSS